jgi:DNA-binding NtrC family response regulator
MEKFFIMEEGQGIRDQLKIGLDGIAGQCAELQELIKSLQGTSAKPESGTIEEAGGGEPSPQQAEVAMATDGTLQGAPGAEGALKAAEPQGEPRSSELPQAESLTLREGRDRVEKGMIMAAIGKCGGNMARASELLGVSRSALYDLMKKHGLFKGNRQHLR